MPKSFNENERAYIKKRLIEEAKICLASYGVRKTTVDELVKRVNIPKGTFYLFYATKELLFYDVLCEFHDEIHDKLMKDAAAIRESVTADKLTDLLFGLYKMADESFMLRFITDGEAELFLRKLPPEIAAEHAVKDNFGVEKLLEVIPTIRCKNIATISAAFRGIFLTMCHKREIGADVYDDALRMTIRGVALQMFEREEK
ncbi:TetR/AcrR family transcriptional regulator [bacterium]|nr:TetR/AcrR family transcriptional regulator [bacterium]